MQMVDDSRPEDAGRLVGICIESLLGEK